MDATSNRETSLGDASTRLAEVEAKCVAHGIVLQAIVALLPPGTVQELKAAATSVDDEGMQEANPDRNCAGSPPDPAPAPVAVAPRPSLSPSPGAGRRAPGAGRGRAAPRRLPE